MKTYLDLWKEEYYEICELQLKYGSTKEISRRLLIFTEGFLFKLSSLNMKDIGKKDKNILAKMILKSSIMKGK